jgi:homoserine kinase
LATSVARSLLPDRYSRADAVANVQATALLMAAFSLDRPELLRVGTDDRLHQPYRMTACPLLEKLLPLAGNPDDCHGIYAVSLSGAGPSVLVFADASKPLDRQIARVSQAAGDESSEVLCTRVSSGYLGYRSAPRPRVTRD